MAPKHTVFLDRPPKYPIRRPYRSGWSRMFDTKTNNVVWHLWATLDPDKLMECKLYASRWALFHGGRLYAANVLRQARVSISEAQKSLATLRSDNNNEKE